MAASYAGPAVTRRRNFETSAGACSAGVDVVEEAEAGVSAIVDENAKRCYRCFIVMVL